MNATVTLALLGCALLGVAAAYVGTDARGAGAVGANRWLRRYGRTLAAALVGAQVLLALGSGAPGAALALLLGAWTVAGWAFTHFAGAWPAATWRTGWWSGLALLASAAALAVPVPGTG